MSFACVKFSAFCAGHSDIEIINTSAIISKSFDPTLKIDLLTKKLFNVKCSKSLAKKVQLLLFSLEVSYNILIFLVLEICII